MRVHQVHGRDFSGHVVRLEPLCLDHAPGLAAAAAEDRTTYGFTTVPEGVDGAAGYVRTLLASAAVGELVPFAQVRVADDAVVGATSYRSMRHRDGRSAPYSVEIGGTWLAASAQRTALNTEAKLLLMTHAFETWQVGRVDLRTDARNERSCTATAALGAQCEGVLRHWQPSHVAREAELLRDTAIFSVTAPEWPAVRARLNDRLGVDPGR